MADDVLAKALAHEDVRLVRAALDDLAALTPDGKPVRIRRTSASGRACVSPTAQVATSAKDTSVESPSAFVVHRATSGTSSALWGDGEENAMAIAPEPGETKCPKCSSAMAQVGITKEEGQTVKHLECPECGQRLKDPAGASSSPPGW